VAEVEQVLQDDEQATQLPPLAKVPEGQEATQVDPNRYVLPLQAVQVVSDPEQAAQADEHEAQKVPFE
jgi:hypothetical protein